ncbi:hypothetical protein O9993_12465 [Vibrio lentus]|nr:hypothetical protein [Vibrio lentus]
MKGHYYYPYHGFLFELTHERSMALGYDNDEDATYSSLFLTTVFYSLTHNDNHICCASRWVTRYLLDAENAALAVPGTYGRQGRNVQRGFVAGRSHRFTRSLGWNTATRFLAQLIF